MKQLLINTELSEEKRIVLLEDDLVVDYETEVEGQTVHKGNIYKAKIESIEPSLEAAFVKLPDDRNGFLPFREIAPSYLKPANNNASIADRLTVGDSLLVQITKEKRDNKGAVLTTYINLQGSYLILMPDQADRNQVSRQAGREARGELQKMLEELSEGQDFGLLLRTSGIECGIEDLRWDLDGYLLKLWRLIGTAYEQQDDIALLYTEHNMPMKIAREHFRKDVDEIVCDTAPMYNELKAVFELMFPEFAERIRMHESEEPLIDLKIEQQLRAIHSRAVSLPSGGQIVFDSTEALVAIDVNSSKGTKWSGVDETALQTNRQAAVEVARQLKLRDLSGLIVIDFIDMDDKDHREQVQQILRKEFRKDRARIRTTDISSLGLLELSRQRLRPSLDTHHSRPCKECNGTGRTRSVLSAAHDILRLVRENSMQPETAAVLVHAPLDVSTYLLNEKRIEVRKLEDLYQTKVVILPDDKSSVGNYKVSPLSYARKRDAALLQKLSYSMEEDEPHEKVQDYLDSTPETPPLARPVVDKMLPEPRQAQDGNSGKNDKGLIGKVLGLLFGSTSEKEPEPSGSSKSAERSRDDRRQDSAQQTGSGRKRSRGGRKSAGRGRQESRDGQPAGSAKNGSKAGEEKAGQQSAQDSERKQGERPSRRSRKPREQSARKPRPAADEQQESTPAQQTKGGESYSSTMGARDSEPSRKPDMPPPAYGGGSTSRSPETAGEMNLGMKQDIPSPNLKPAIDPRQVPRSPATAPLQQNTLQQVETKTPQD